MGLASIERLPVELLQPIFIESGHNLALLQSSPYIAARLSSEYIYNSTCDYYLTGVHGERTRQSSAQTFIFASKCMTWAFLKSWCLRRFGSKGCFCDRKPEEGCFDAQWPPNFDDATKMVFSRSHLPRLAFVKGRIPLKLLRGPWSSSKIEFLRFLLWMTSMSVDWHDPDTAQAAIHGRKVAIIEQNLEAVELFNHNRRLGRPANLETVAFAVMEAGCNRSVVYDTLLVANMWSNNQSTRYSDALHEWCDGQIATGNPKGTWLLKKLEESLILRARDGLKRGDCQEKMHARHVALEITSETYDSGFEDLLTVNELEWNKVCQHFLSFQALSLYFHRIFCHDIAEVAVRLDSLSVFGSFLAIELRAKYALGESSPRVAHFEIDGL